MYIANDKLDPDRICKYDQLVNSEHDRSIGYNNHSGIDKCAKHNDLLCT